VVSKPHLRPNSCVANLFKMLTLYKVEPVGPLARLPVELQRLIAFRFERAKLANRLTYNYALLLSLI
jgi:hypothetical protein